MRQTQKRSFHDVLSTGETISLSQMNDDIRTFILNRRTRQQSKSLRSVEVQFKIGRVHETSCDPTQCFWQIDTLAGSKLYFVCRYDPMKPKPFSVCMYIYPAVIAVE